MDRGQGGSRWTSQRKKKQARLAANEEGGSDLSSSNESEPEQPVPKRTRNDSSEYILSLVSCSCLEAYFAS